MRDYYHLLNFDGTPRPMSDLLGRMYRAWLPPGPPRPAARTCSRASTN